MLQIVNWLFPNSSCSHCLLFSFKDLLDITITSRQVQKFSYLSNNVNSILWTWLGKSSRYLKNITTTEDPQHPTCRDKDLLENFYHLKILETKNGFFNQADHMVVFFFFFSPNTQCYVHTEKIDHRKGHYMLNLIFYGKETKSVIFLQFQCNKNILTVMWGKNTMLLIPKSDALNL